MSYKPHKKLLEFRQNGNKNKKPIEKQFYLTTQILFIFSHFELI